VGLGHGEFSSSARGRGEAAAPEMSGVCALVLAGGHAECERFAGLPLALFDVLGRSVLMRTLDRLRASGVRQVAALSDAEPLPPPPTAAGCRFSVAPRDCFWSEAWQQFRQLSRQAESVFVIRLGAWAEVNYAAMAKQHARLGGAMLRAYSRRGEALDVLVVSSDGRSEAAALLRGELRDERITAAPHRSSGYVNRLDTPASLRLLTLDALAGEAEIAPMGSEMRPGVWVGRGARIHRGARVIAPAFIGAGCTVHRGVVVTRGSALEHHSEVDCGSVIDNSTLLPYSRIGAGLDVEQAVAGMRVMHSSRLNTTVEIDDPRLVGSTAEPLPRRAMNLLTGIFALLPEALWELVAGAHGQSLPAREAKAKATIGDPALTPLESQADSCGEMAATRRYGNE